MVLSSKGHRPAMVIVDRAFTGKYGFDLCRQLRSMGEYIPRINAGRTGNGCRKGCLC